MQKLTIFVCCSNLIEIFGTVVPTYKIIKNYTIILILSFRDTIIVYNKITIFKVLI